MMIRFSSRILIISILFPLFLWAPHLSSQPVNQTEEDQAIEKGIDYLKELFKTRKGIGKTENRVGATALAVYTLLECDVPLKDRTIAYGLNFLTGQPLTETYQTALIALVMATALEKAKVPKPDKPDMNVQRQNGHMKKKKGPADKPFPKPDNPMLPYYRKKLEVAITWLIRAQRPSCQDGRAWGYRFADRVHFDNSNTQFALLGLLAGRNAGIKIPKSVWQKALKHFEAAQCKDGSWGYKSTSAGYGSMTAAGISSMIICLSALQEKPDLDKTLKNEMITAALKWLQKHWDIYGHRGHVVQAGLNKPKPKLPPDYYWLYALERMGTFSAREKIGGHDWYAEGVSLILEKQRPNGSWRGMGMGGALPHTCFALLFFKKVSIPLQPPPRPWPEPVRSGSPEDTPDSEEGAPPLENGVRTR